LPLAGLVGAGLPVLQVRRGLRFHLGSPLNAGQLKYHINATNSLVGAQTGGDAWVCIIPGIRAGGEFKAGIYGNHSSQGTKFTATSLIVPYTESAGSNDVAFVSDAAFYITWRINYQLNLKLGYNFLYVDGLTLAAENFNKTPPATFVNGSGRVPTLNDNGNVFYTATLSAWNTTGRKPAKTAQAHVSTKLSPQRAGSVSARSNIINDLRRKYYQFRKERP